MAVNTWDSDPGIFKQQLHKSLAFCNGSANYTQMKQQNQRVQIWTKMNFRLVHVVTVLAITSLILVFPIYQTGSMHHKALVVIDVLSTKDQMLMELAKIDMGDMAMERQAASVLGGESWKDIEKNTWWSSLISSDASSSPWKLELASNTRNKNEAEAAAEDEESLMRWKTDLQRWMYIKMMDYDPRVLWTLLESVKEPVDSVHAAASTWQKIRSATRRTQPYESCAVVGNSGILLSQNYGELIDSHAAVIRLNYAPTDGFENQVGSKTTIAFVNSNVLRSHRRRDRCRHDDVATVLYLCQPAHIRDAHFCAHVSKAPVIVTDPSLDTLASRLAKFYSLKLFVGPGEFGPAASSAAVHGAWSAAHDGDDFHYSSGFEAVLVALGICRHVSLFGFGKATSAQHHYHSKWQRQELGLHDYAAEYQFYRHVAAANLSTPFVIPFISDSGFPLPSLHIYT